MHTRGFESNKGTIKGPKNMNGKYCLQPFTNIDIHSNHGARCCSESWMPSWVGDFSEQTLKQIWNAQPIRDIRQSVLDGSYSFCDWHQCPFYCNDSYYLYTEDDLLHPERLSPVHAYRLSKYAPWIRYILERKTEVDIMPANYNLAYDETCNLACPSCRNQRVMYTKGPEYTLRLSIHNKLLKEVKENGFENIGRFNVTGSGEPFVSKIFSDFLYNFDGKRFPRLDINIQSNGVLFTPQAWEKMKKIHSNINEVIVSLDAACAETYDKIRVNGSFKKLLSNIEFLAALRKQGKIRRFMLAYVVQEKNFREMTEAIRIGKHFGVDLFIFNLLNDWKSWQPTEYETNAVWKVFHPEFKEFLEILRDPLFSDPIVDLGNMTEYREKILSYEKVT
ncbi:MAG: radical SAM protein [Spirochaetales bacterium]|nr:radical SAM protein [Spirochaetales bacterium]